MLSRTGSSHKSAESVLGEEGCLQLEELVERGVLKGEWKRDKVIDDESSESTEVKDDDISLLVKRQMTIANVEKSKKKKTPKTNHTLKLTIITKKN